MTTWAILATGPSMSQAVADRLRGRCHVAAVSDAYRLAPWADVLASTDAAWWREHPDALQFAGRRYTGAPYFTPVPGVERPSWATTGTNSGLLACQTAHALGATRLLLFGFDMHGSHFFGSHPPPLRNTSAERFKALVQQFDRWRPRDLQVVNCTPGSALTVYPFSTAEKELP